MIRTRRPFRPAAALLAAALLSAWPAVADDAPAKADDAVKTKEKASLTPNQTARNVESFEVVWKTIRDKHFDPKLGGLDWQAVHDELKPKVERASSMTEARAAITEALERLHQTHFGIIPSDVARALDDTSQPPAGNGETGLTVRLIEGKPVVTAVEEGSPAAKAGVKAGWVLVKVRDKPLDDALRAAEKAYAKSGMVEAYKAIAVISRLHGPSGGSIPIEFLDGDDKPVSLKVGLADPKGVVARFGNLPPFHVRFVSRKVEGTIAYVSLNVFFDPANVLRQFAEVMKTSRDADGLILDLRGNPGGIGAMALGLGGWFVSDADRKLGTMITRDGSINFSLNPRPTPYEGPVAVLVDELSMSTSEILGGGLRDLKRARVFGTKTPGAALPSRVDVLPNGDRFQYAFANYISVGGKPLEGVGVEPDARVPLTRAALLSGRDPVVDAAVGWIRGQKAARTTAPK